MESLRYGRTWGTSAMNLGAAASLTLLREHCESLSGFRAISEEPTQEGEAIFENEERRGRRCSSLGSFYRSRLSIDELTARASYIFIGVF